MKKGGENIPTRGNSTYKGPVVREHDKCKGLKGHRAQDATVQAGEGQVMQPGAGLLTVCPEPLKNFKQGDMLTWALEGLLLGSTELSSEAARGIQGDL